jgi:hypothetical protein
MANYSFALGIAAAGITTSKWEKRSEGSKISTRNSIAVKNIVNPRAISPPASEHQHTAPTPPALFALCKDLKKTEVAVAVASVHGGFPFSPRRAKKLFISS